VSEDGALVSMMLSNSEKLIVAGLQGRARDEALFRYWTRKEAAAEGHRSIKDRHGCGEIAHNL
jgi:hypothetical protein